MTRTLHYLQSREWTMGGGNQCPDCCGWPEASYPHPNHLTPDTLGHEPTCELALSIRELGGTTLLKGESQRVDRYRSGITDDGFFTVFPKDRPLSEREKLYTEDLNTGFLKMLNDSFMEAWRGLPDAIRDAKAKETP